VTRTRDITRVRPRLSVARAIIRDRVRGEGLLNQGRHLGMISHSAAGRAAFGASKSDRIAVDSDLMREAIGLNSVLNKGLN
jgi:hypothetical protein